MEEGIYPGSNCVGDGETHIDQIYFKQEATGDLNHESGNHHEKKDESCRPEDFLDEEEWMNDELERLREDELYIDMGDDDVEADKETVTSQEETLVSCKEQTNCVMINYSYRKTMKLQENGQLSEEIYICEYCHKVFGNKYKLDTHISLKHLINSGEEVVDNSKESLIETWPPNVQNLARRIDGTKIFFCCFCPYNVNRCDSMAKHIMRVHSEGRDLPQYQCEICGKLFKDKAYLRNHGVSHRTDRVYECDKCGKAFHRQASLRRHLQNHSDEKNFYCSLCEYKTNRKHLMYRHVEHHENGRTFTCAICGKRTYTQLSARRHMYTHKLSSNCCSFCKVHFSSKERMMCHMQKVHFNHEIQLLDVKPEIV